MLPCFLSIFLIKLTDVGTWGALIIGGALGFGISALNEYLLRRALRPKVRLGVVRTAHWAVTDWAGSCAGVTQRYLRWDVPWAMVFSAYRQCGALDPPPPAYTAEDSDPPQLPTPDDVVGDASERSMLLG